MARRETRRVLPCGAVAALFVSAAAAAGERPAARPAELFAYVPPSLEDRVVLYHSFEKGLAAPEINLVDARVTGAATPAGTGLTGKGYRPSEWGEVKDPLRIRTDALSPHRPLTLSVWWRLDAPMKDESCFHLVTMSGRGYFANFVRGKGEWCALREPTFIFQIYNFEGIPNANNPWGGPARFEPGEWHNVAVTVANASDIRVYWDGVERSRHAVKGRAFREGDVNVVELGCHWLYHPMTVDEVLLLDRALTAEEVAEYVEAVRELARVGFPAECANQPAPRAAASGR